MLMKMKNMEKMLDRSAYPLTPQPSLTHTHICVYKLTFVK